MKTRIIRSPGPRHHAEAYPRLDLRETRKQVMTGRGEVIWRNQRGDVLGKASVTLDRNRLTLSSGFLPFQGMPARVEQDVFLLQPVDRGAGATDYLTQCSGCGASVRILILKELSWRCQKCQGLGYRSAMIGQVSRQTERLDELDALVGDGRPKGMHETSFQALRHERAELKALLADTRLSPSSSYAEVVTTYWQQEGPELQYEGDPYTGQPFTRRRSGPC